MGYPYTFEVINAGHYAFDNAQEYMLYLKEGRKYQPDVVLVMYACDEASSEYAELGNDDVLSLRFKQFTMSQKLYRRTVSFIRKKSHFGSFLLARMNRISGLRSFLMKRKLRERDIAIVSPRTIIEKEHDSNNSLGFKALDKAIWRAFNRDVEMDGARLIFLTMDKVFLDDKKTHFLKENGILVMNNEVSYCLEAKNLKENDLKKGIYDRFYESNRCGYKMNEKVAEDIIDFLERHAILPKHKPTPRQQRL